MVRSNSMNKTFLKDLSLINEDSFNEKTSILIMQISYTLFLCSVNLGVWDTALNIYLETKSYITKVRENVEYARWEIYKQGILDDRAQELIDKLNLYPKFEFGGTTLYHANPILKQALEGTQVVTTECESFENLKGLSKILLRTLFRWMMNEEYSKIFTDNFRIDEVKYISTYQTHSIGSLISYISEYSIYLKYDFFTALTHYPTLLQVEIGVELRKLLTEYGSCQIPALFTHINPYDIHLNEMKMNYTILIKTDPFLDAIDEVIFVRLFTIVNSQNESEIEDQRAKIFKDGIEVLKYGETNGSHFKINGIALVRDGLAQELVVLVEKQMIKHNVFDALFGTLRHKDGRVVVKKENVEGRYTGNYANNSSSRFDEKQLKLTPLPLKILYHSIFEEQERKDILGIRNMAWSTYSSKAVSDVSVISQDTSELSCIVAHPKLPICFAGKRSSVVVINITTTSIIANLETLGKPIIFICSNNYGDRIAAIDSSGNFMIWRYSLELRMSSPILVLKGMEAVTACFTTDATRILISTKTRLINYDLIDHRTDIDDIKATCTLDKESGISLLCFLPFSTEAIGVKGKKGQIIQYSLQTKMRSSMLEISGDITSICSNKIGSIIAVGQMNGSIKLIQSSSLEVMKEINPFASGKLDYLQIRTR